MEGLVQLLCVEGLDLFYVVAHCIMLMAMVAWAGLSTTTCEDNNAVHV